MGKLKKSLVWHINCTILQMNKYPGGEFDMRTEPYPQILTEREKAIFFMWVVLHNAICVMEKAEGLSAEGRKSLLEELSKQIA